MSDPEEDPTAKTRALLATLWQRNLPILQDRLTELEEAAEAAATHTLTEPAQESAAATAHKLAGSLGMFGYPEATDQARKIEHLLTAPTKPDPPTLRGLTAAALRTSLNL